MTTRIAVPPSSRDSIESRPFRRRTRSSTKFLLLRKEVIHPQLPLGMPCYDFVPIAGFTFETQSRFFGYIQLS